MGSLIDPAISALLPLVLPKKLPAEKPLYYTDFEYRSDYDFFRLPHIAEVYQNVANRVREVTPNVQIDDGGAAWWTSSGIGSGAIAPPVLSDDDVKFIKGIDSLKMPVGSGTNARWSIIHTYEVPQDWSKYKFIVFYWNGAGTDSLFRPTIWTPFPDGAGYHFTDDFVGWRRIVCPLELFFIVAGTPDWSSVIDLVIENRTSNVTATWHTDRLYLDTELLVLRRF